MRLLLFFLAMQCKHAHCKLFVFTHMLKFNFIQTCVGGKFYVYVCVRIFEVIAWGNLSVFLAC